MIDGVTGRNFLVLLALVWWTRVVAAQVVEVSPPNPTSADLIVLSVAAPELGFVAQPVTVNGSAIGVTFRGGSDFPAFETHQVTLPPLSPGAYAVTVTFVFLDASGELDHVVTLAPFILQVLPGGAAIPVLSIQGLLAIIASLAALGAVAVRRL